MTLTEIANKHQCDKGTQHFDKHGYTETYSKLIDRTTPYRMLEIGIFTGASLRMWKEYNPAIQLSAIDINPECLTLENEKLADIHIVDQGNKYMLDDIVGKFDFIIDDGSHKMSDHQIALSALFKKLKSGGKYFIEDLHVCRWFPRREQTDNLLRALGETGILASPYLSGRECQELERMIVGIDFYNDNKLVALTRK